MAADVMYSLSDLFKFVTHSECQCFNMIERQIAKATSCSKEEMERALEDLKYIHSLLEDRDERLLQMSTFWKSRGEPQWPAATQQAHVEVVNETLQAVEGDLDHLLRRSKNLSSRCIEGANMITNTAMLEESKKAMGQAERLNRLSLLAFFFLPLQLASSVFGMNFKQFGQGPLSIWMFPLVLIPVLVVSALLTFWDRTMSIAKRYWKHFGAEPSLNVK